jgi:hypothetical protein
MEEENDLFTMLNNTKNTKKSQPVNTYYNKKPLLDQKGPQTEYDIINAAFYQENATVTIYKEGSNYVARKGTNGDIISINSDFSTVCNAAGSWITGNGIIFVKDPGADIVPSATITFTNKEIFVTSDYATIDFSLLDDEVFIFIDATTPGTKTCGISNFRMKGDKTLANQIFAKFSDMTAIVDNLTTSGADHVRQVVYLYGACTASNITRLNCIAHDPIKILGYVSGSTYEASGTDIHGNFFDCDYDGVNTNTGIDITYGTGILISDNHIKNSVWGIVSVDSPDMEISNNYLSGGLVGCDLNSNFAHVSNNHIYCRFASCMGIKFYSTFGGTIVGNSIYSSNNHDFHGIELDTVKRVTIVGNHILEEQTPASTFGIYSGGTSNEVTIVGNVITGTSSMTATAIYSLRFDDCTIVGNTIRNFSTGINIVTNNNCIIANNVGHITKNRGTSTGTGAQQTIAHGLAAIPNNVMITPTATGATEASITAAADATNIYPTVTNLKTYQWMAELI